MSKINELWNKKKLPIKNGIYFANGESFSFLAKFYPDIVIKKGKSFSLVDFLNQNPDCITDIDIFKKIKIPTDGACLLGEGSHGSEGFIAYITSDEKLNWVIYFEESNPFINAVELPDTFLKVESSANYRIILDLKDPINIVSINEIEV
ncbi:hypothetical protein [Gilliamella apicola]|uniref:hypothetical protein n=1 Tax=Gilliamella apicola TaxID=1196095 RepID=UPI00080DFEFD|nr:hypothetical protein [Gilliamella apicola]OCG10546.1 hypothetical protein A9G14_09990 [Gilliamella apicola]ORF44079.1 hypothetical protein B5800_12805 [Gilliamella apicola]ORF47459.1 hypothetical protein B5799_12550 [Gilliamella apicola]ORF49710.1 hypothetical protein B5803_10215 [Gilliamella apicola]ORF50841.1 hypothetical protein B5802_12220 [Gilliamella apicola]